MQNELSAWAQGRIEGEKAIDLINEIWWVGSLEGYWSQRGRLAADAVMVALAHSEWVFCLFLFSLSWRSDPYDSLYPSFIPLSAWAAKEWADTAATWYGYELGTDSEYVQEMKDVIKSPQTQRTWGSRGRQSVGGPLKKT